MKQGQSSTPADIPVLKMSTGISVGVDDWACFTIFYCYDPYWF